MTEIFAAAAGLTDVIDRLRNNESLDAIVASLRPPGEHELLRRASVVRAFDQRLFDQILAADMREGEQPDFADFVRLPEVEPLPRTDGMFQLQAGAKLTNWKAWWPEGADTSALPAPLSQFVRLLVDYYRKCDRAVDLLAQLAFVEREEALALFRDLFHEADTRFDLAACQDLIDVLNDPDRAPFIGPKLTAERNDRVSYLRARSLWSAEYYQAEKFMESGNALAVYEEFMRGKDCRVLNLHAPGGSGKTIQLRWLIARELVPERKRKRGHAFGGGRIACAKVDFDFVHPETRRSTPGWC